MRRFLRWGWVIGWRPNNPPGRHADADYVAASRGLLGYQGQPGVGPLHDAFLHRLLSSPARSDFAGQGTLQLYAADAIFALALAADRMIRDGCGRLVLSCSLGRFASRAGARWIVLFARGLQNNGVAPSFRTTKDPGSYERNPGARRFGCYLTGKDRDGNLLRIYLRQLSFEGVSGLVNFTDAGNRLVGGRSRQACRWDSRERTSLEIIPKARGL